MSLPTEILDLHGLTVADAMSRFARKYNWIAANTAPGETRVLQIIHGKGKIGAESLIRETLRSFLRAQGKRISGYDARLALMGAIYLLDNCGRLAYMHGEDVDRNGGQTFVVPRERIRAPR